MLICVDPGSSKTGIAVMNKAGEVLQKKIVPTEDMENHLQACIDRYKPDIIIMGNGTWSKKTAPRVMKRFNVPFKLVNEKHSTERARMLYFKENPPKGIWKIIPLTLQVPDKPYDDYAAVVIARDYLDSLSGGKAPFSRD